MQEYISPLSTSQYAYVVVEADFYEWIYMRKDELIVLMINLRLTYIFHTSVVTQVKRLRISHKISAKYMN